MMAPIVRTARDRERELRMMLGLPTAAEPWHGAGHERAQSQIALLARLAQGRMALSCAGHVILRMDG